MSAIANTRVHQNTSNKQTDNSVEDDMVDVSTKTVSAIARIDYIQRFSKQMTVVFDNNPTVYAKVARQYLASISQESSNQDANVAFVAASNKINDIQMRCRLIEQLFANTLFDPEQSLAVSILRLSKQNNGIITVIVEHAQSLSLQIKYELCQLVDTAKKTQNNINVVIFGSEQAAIEIGQNRTIFDKKASIVEASSGQVVALDHARFKQNSTAFNYAIGLKIGLASLISLLIIGVAWYVMSEYESVNFATLPVKAPVINEPLKVTEKVSKIVIDDKLASVSDVHFALISKEVNQIAMIEEAKNNDILQALMLTETTVHGEQQVVSEEATLIIPDVKVEIETVNTGNIEQAKLSKLADSPMILNEEYYLGSEKGFVIQITAFSNLSRLNTFTEQNGEQEYFSYQKSLNNQHFFILTSKVFGDKNQAREAMNKLPDNVKSLGVFLKSVSTIKDEINTVSQ